MKILIAEDDDTSRLVLAERLRKLGHEVVSAENGRKAWEAFLASPPQVIVTDWMMPVMDGLELTRKVREHLRPGYTYVIIFTALDSKVGYFEGMSAGADDFMTKPCEIVDLNMRLRVAERILSLQNEVEQLQGLLSICPRCKRIRDDHGRWHTIDAFMTERAEAHLSHGVCPECCAGAAPEESDVLKKEGQSE